MNDVDHSLTAEDRSQNYTSEALGRAVRESCAYVKKIFGRAPVISEVCNVLAERHKIYRTVTQLNTAILENEELFEIASNLGFAVSPGHRTRWFKKLPESVQKKITVVVGRRDDLPIDDVLSRLTIVENGATIHNPMEQFAARTKNNATVSITNITKLRRKASISPRKANHMAMEAVRRIVEEAHASTRETSNLRLQLKENLSKIAAPAKKKAKS